MNMTNQNKIYLFLGLLVFGMLAGTANAAYTIQEFGTNSFRYSSGVNITVSGKLMNDTVEESGANITLEIFNQSGALINTFYSTTDSTGFFSKIIATNPLTEGRYTIVPSAQVIGVAAPGINVLIYGGDEIKSITASFIRGTVQVVALNETGYGNKNINGTLYWFLVSSGNTISVDTDPTINTTNTIRNLVTNSRVKLGSNTYSVFFVQRTSEIILARMVQPVFTGSEGFYNLTLLALNSSDHPLSGKNLTLKISNSSGIIETQVLSSTESNGLATSNITIQSAGGLYTIQFMESNETIGTISYSVNSFDISGDVLSSEWTPQRTFAQGQNATFTVSVKTTAGVIYNGTGANIIAYIRGPRGFLEQHNLSFNPNRSVFYYVYQIPDNATQGTYAVEYVTTIGSQILRSYSNFEIRGYNLFLKPIGKVNEMSGFFPGEEAYIMVSGTDLGTGEIANLNLSTDGSNKDNFTFSIKNSEGVDVTGSWGAMSLDRFFIEAQIDEWLQNEIRGRAPNASIINFTSPDTEAMYDVIITANLNGATQEARTSIGIQRIFLNAFPVSSDGNFAMSVSSQDNVTLRIDAFNPSTMSIETNISNVGIVEAFAVDTAEIVTDKMLNPSLVILPDGSKGLKFYNNDSNLGFHMIKFWANVTLHDGTTSQAIGTGFFNTRLYYIWTQPAMTDGGNFMTFSGDSNISLRIQVMNTGFSPQSGKTVEVDEIRHVQSWEKIDFDSESDMNWSGTTDSNGIANLTIHPSSPLKSGGYDVRIKLTADDASGNSISDYGRGWFEVRNFMFWVNPTNWNVKAGENISFDMRAVNSTNMNSALNLSVQVKKVMLRTDWSQPPIEIGGTHKLNGSDSIDISTNMSQSATVIYNGTTNKAGMYEFVFEANTDSGIIEETRTWLEIRPFVAWISLPRGNDWNSRYGVNNTVNLIVHASDSNNWEAQSMQLDANRTNITSVMKMGMFGGAPYKKQSQLNITNVTYDSYDPNAVNITLSLTNWAEGEYDMVINAVDTAGNEVLTHFWLRVEVASVGLPQFYNVGIPESRVYTNKVSFNLSDETSQKVNDNAYPGLTSDVANNFTNSKIGLIGQYSNIKGQQLLRMEQNEPQARTFWALVNTTSPGRFYVNYNNSNFSDANTTYAQNMTIGEIFNEVNDAGVIIRRWNLTHIGEDGTIEMEGISTLNNGYIIDTSISKSGNFIMESNFRDDQWRKIDLDGNGQYQSWDGNSRNNTYYIILADNESSGVYDTVIVSNTTNFTRNGIIAKNATTADPVTFGGPAIYYISMKREGPFYNIAFTSYQAGFDGMWLGTFEKGKELRIPFMVQYPGTTNGIPGVNVNVTRLTWYSPDFQDVMLTNEDAPGDTTDANGLAIINVNTSNIPNGQYLIAYTISGQGISKSPAEKYKLPGMEIRKFVVSAQAGNVGSISTSKVSDGSGLNVVYGTEIEPRGATMAFRQYPSDIYRVGWPFNMENEYYFNATSGSYHTGFDQGNTTGIAVENNSINLTRNGANTTYNFTAFYPDSTNISLTVGVPQMVFGYWNMTLQSVDPGQVARLRIDYLYDDMTPQDNPPACCTYATVGSRIFWGPGDLNIEITAINNTMVWFELFQPKILYQIESMGVLMDGNDANGEWDSGRVTKVSNYSGTGYDVYGYNDVNQTQLEGNQNNGWSPTLDSVMVTNSTWNQTYRIGQLIPALNNQYVGLVARWGGKIIFVNSTDTRIFPFPDWAADGDTYYLGTFTESDINADINNNQNITDSTPYYIRLEDNSPNGVFTVTTGMFDDDKDFTQAGSMSGMWTPLDLYTQEQGGTDMQGNKFDEKWITLGSMFGWPFGVPEITYNGNFANLTTFKERWNPFSLSDNVTVYVNAKTFSNQPINGNVSLDKLMVLFKSNMSDATGPVSGGSSMTAEGTGGGGGTGGGDIGTGKGPGAPQSYVIPNVTVPIVNGIGVWRINYSVIQPVVGSFDSGNFAAKLNITDNEGNFENAEISFFMQNSTVFMGPTQPGGPGGI
ncbi:MAG: hypothetical protein OIN86_07720 [Candidatus Methanoperedens sp.]|nr:hypothetical protein [Candidatus Methanoperedens sp.]CAG0976692.1 hypothetical protein METP1_01542 [Methanosarcinales archaeon]